MIKMILATDVNGGLGFQNSLPWYIPEDLQYFKSVTDGQTVVMGRKTFESLPFKNGLPNRLNWIISHNKKAAGIGNIVTDVSAWVLHSEYLNRIRGDIWIIGGRSIYEQLFHFVEEVHHTKINASYECDTFIDTNLWENNPDFKVVETVPLCDNVGVNIWRRV